MNAPLPHPFTLVFEELADDRFPAIRDALGDQDDLDSFLFAAPALELLRDLRPDSGLGDAVDDFVAFVHAAYRYWASGAVTEILDEAATRALCDLEWSEKSGFPNRGDTVVRRSVRHDSVGISHAIPETAYIQIAPRLIWGRLTDEETFEPLDGWFASTEGARLRMVACFGVHPGRPGLSIVAAAGERQPAIARPDGSRVFAPIMPGGDAAELFAVASPAELLLLAWRAKSLEEGHQWR